MGCHSYRTASRLDKTVLPLDKKINIGMEVISLKTGKIIYSHNPDRYFIPASTEKVLTALAALAELGQDFQFKTQLLEDKHSNLTIKFEGDPVLTEGDLFNLFKELKVKFPEKTFNNIMIDLNDHDLPLLMPGWMIGDAESCYGAPVNRAILNKNCTYDKEKQRVAVKVRHINAAMKKNILTQVTAHHIAYTGKIKVYSKLRSRPEKTLVLEHSSPSLFVLLHEGLKDSDNLIMEALFIKLVEDKLPIDRAWQERGEPLKELILKYYGVDLAEASTVDGSGLTRYNLITPHQLTAILVSAYKNNKVRPELLSLLPIAGIDGTLKNRMRKGLAYGKIRAKTGGMTGLISLAGFGEDKRGEAFAFTIMINQFVGSAEDQRNLVDHLCEIMIDHQYLLGKEKVD